MATLIKSDFLKILENKCQNYNNNIFDFSFELDEFQKNAITSIQNDENVIITAHTGAGKTVPAIYAIADSIAKNKKIIYTSPIKSLSNQKFEELKKYFDSVGILTGDIKFNPDAQCLIVTTEILRNSLYNNSKDSFIDINNIDKVIFDEIHYINDPHRGKVWEETLVLLPSHITILMLSATIDKAEDFASWIGNIKKKNINLIPTKKRVIPLKHYYYIDDELIEIVDENNNYKNYNKIQEKYQVTRSLNMIDNFVKYLKNRNRLPALFFLFSRNDCEKHAKIISLNLVSSEEAAEIRNIFNYRMRNFRERYEKMPQYIEIYKLIEKGIAYHHSGLIPVLKEIIEILFGKGLIKILFATETFAVGVNMPTKTVVFPKLKKYSDGGFRYLRSDEYSQMAGRAGRRGLDKTGTTILLPADELLPSHSLKNMMVGKSPCIKSKFCLNYQFLLKILSSKEKDILGFMNKSLFNSDTQDEMTFRENEKIKILDDLKKSDKPMDDSLIKKFNEYLEIKDICNNSFIKIKQKKLKKYKNQMREIENLEDFENKYTIYSEVKSKQKEIERIDTGINYLANFMELDIINMIHYLKKNGYIDIMDEDDKPISIWVDVNKSDYIKNQDRIRPTIKALIATEINECNEIIFTEIIERKILNNLQPNELVAIIAGFIKEKKSDEEYISQLRIPKKLKDKLEEVNNIASEMCNKEIEEDIQINTDWSLHLGVIESAYMWASGKSIYEIFASCDISYEGNFIRNMLRINNICEDIKKIAELTKNDVLLKLVEPIESMLIRDQVTTDSLYIQ